MTNIYQAKIVIKPCDPEAFCTAEGQKWAKELISGMEEADVSMPPVSYTLGANFIETGSSALDVVEARLRASGLNREGGTECYTELEPGAANLPSVPPGG